MFGIGSTELLIIGVVALLVIGPSKLPEMMKMLGRGVAEFRRMSTDVKDTLNAEVERAENESRKKKSRAELFPDEQEQSSNKPESSTQAESTKATSNDSTTADDKNSREA
jgi:sec-independent protein translocase protein TatB